MTASDMVSVIAEVLLAHKGDHHQDDWWTICKCGENWPVGGDCKSSEVAAEFAAHQARAVLAALEQAGGVEWGVRLQDKSIEHVYSQSAGELVAMDYATVEAVVSRITGPWTAVQG